MSRRVLMTRSLKRSELLVTRLTSQGLEVVVVPVTVVKPLASIVLPPDLEAFDWIAFTSVHGVEAFAEALARATVDLPSTCRLASVGPATTKAIREHLKRDALESPSAGGEALAAAVVQSAPRNARVLWPCAKDARPEFLAGLTMAGLSVSPLICYETQAETLAPLQAALKAAAPWHAAVFYAPSAVAAFCDAWPLPWPFRAVAIGPTTARRLVEAGALEVMTAHATDPDALIAAILYASSPLLDA